MKTHKHLYPRLCSYDNLFLAARRAMQRKRSKSYVDTFWLNLEGNIIALRRDLAAESYTPGRYRNFYAREPKKRFISAAPFRDRVVHHALCNVIEPIFDRSFIHDTYSCRRGKGTHMALDRCRRYLRRFRYVLKVDIRQYFDSIDHDVLLALISRRLRCPRTMGLVKKIVASHTAASSSCAYFPGDNLFTPYQRPRGLPIGNLTSQLFANLYLDGFDHYVKEELRAKGYIRYTDDAVLFADSKDVLWRWHDLMARYLERLRLRFNERKTRVLPVTRGVDFLGFKLYPHRVKILRPSVKRFRARMRQLWRERAAGEIEAERVGQSVLGWAAHAAYGDTYRLREALYGEFQQQQGADLLLRPCSSRRLVEQQR